MAGRPTGTYTEVPLFFSFAPDRGCGRVLDLHPTVGAARSIGRTEPLRHDALATERPSLTVDDRAMRVERDARMLAAQKRLDATYEIYVNNYTEDICPDSSGLVVFVQNGNEGKHSMLTSWRGPRPGNRCWFVGRVDGTSDYREAVNWPGLAQAI